VRKRALDLPGILIVDDGMGNDRRPSPSLEETTPPV